MYPFSEPRLLLLITIAIECDRLHVCFSEHDDSNALKQVPEGSKAVKYSEIQ